MSPAASALASPSQLRFGLRAKTKGNAPRPVARAVTSAARKTANALIEPRRVTDGTGASSSGRPRHVDLELDRKVERGGHETARVGLLGQAPDRLDVLSLEAEPQQEPREAEAAVLARARDAVGVHAQTRVGDILAGGEPGEGNRKTGGCRSDKKVLGAPGGG